MITVDTIVQQYNIQRYILCIDTYPLSGKPICFVAVHSQYINTASRTTPYNYSNLALYIIQTKCELFMKFNGIQINIG
jgi:hypothetical protein